MAGTSNQEFLAISCLGRIVFDLKQIATREDRLRSYSFADAVQTSLNITKEVLNESTLTDLWESGHHGIKRSLDYVRRDIMRCMQLFRNSGTVITYIELARVTGLNISVRIRNTFLLFFFFFSFFRFLYSKPICFGYGTQ